MSDVEYDHYSVSSEEDYSEDDGPRISYTEYINGRFAQWKKWNWLAATTPKAQCDALADLCTIVANFTPTGGVVNPNITRFLETTNFAERSAAKKEHAAAYKRFLNAGKTTWLAKK